LDSRNNTLDALPAIWTWKKISELRHQALHPTETSPTRVPFRHVALVKIPATIAQPPNITNYHQNTFTPPHTNAQETQTPNRKRRFFLYVEQASDEEERTGHNFFPSFNQHSTDMLWQY
jgi:hypothetical protein